MEAFHWLDWTVLGVFFLALIGIVIWVSRMKEDTTSDYFLAGRDAGWIVIGASIFASNIGSEHLVGLAGAGASSGMAMAHWELHAWVMILLAWVFVPFYYRSGVYTMPEFLERQEVFVGRQTEIAGIFRRDMHTAIRSQKIDTDQRGVFAFTG